MRIKGGFGPDTTPTPLCIFLASYHATSTTASAGIAPWPVPDHITALSQAGSLSSTHLLSGVLSVSLSVSFFFFSFSFLDRSFVPSNHHVNCQIRPAPHAHRVPDVTAFTPLSLPPASWSFRYAAISQSLTHRAHWLSSSSRKESVVLNILRSPSKARGKT